MWSSSRTNQQIERQRNPVTGLGHVVAKRWGGFYYEMSSLTPAFSFNLLFTRSQLPWHHRVMILSQDWQSSLMNLTKVADEWQTAKAMDFKKGEVENLAGELWVDPRTHELLQLGVDKTLGGMTKPPQRGWKWMTDLSAKIVKYFYVNLKKRNHQGYCILPHN